MQGNWGPRNAYTENVDAWVEQRALEIPEDVVAQARAVIKRVLTASSKLLELWQETPEFEAWKGLVEGLEERVGG